MPFFTDIYYRSSTQKNTIHALICKPDSSPRAIIQIVHGIADHISRYSPFMEFMANNGFVVCGEDHLGHGKSISSSEETGFFAEEDGWNYVLSDIDTLRTTIRQEFPELPYIFFGHSMGSFLTRTYIIKNPDKYDAVIISGTGHQPPHMVMAGFAMADAAVKLYGPRKKGVILDSIAFGAYNKGFDNPRTRFDWISRNQAEVDKYIEDPYCGFIGTVSLFRDMMGGVKFIINQNKINSMNKDRPVLFISGSADPVGENGKGVERAYKAFCKAGIRDITMKLYKDGRHEMLNEINREDVFNYILNWANSKI